MKKSNSISKKEQQQGVAIFLVVLILGVLGIRSCFTQDEQIGEEQTRDQKVEECFMVDGSHVGVVLTIKKLMNDPDSYKHLDTKYWDYDSMLRVQITFSGKNGFGGTIKNTMTALCDLDCNVIALAEGTDLPER